jgi:N-methylhydantoinase B/oxoprolinase/acetone carboxylase alpha subunit
VTAGAGGYGDPRTRNPALLLEDVLEERLTPDYVLREYGLAVDAQNQKVNTK